ncbi:hypothetical protein JXQ70_10065 [bacterium]|nr:hypothetical protein [bacterium]
MRMVRIVFNDADEGYYHISGRTVMNAFIIKEAEKRRFIEILHKLAQVYYVQVIDYVVLSNHFHLIVKPVKPGQKLRVQDFKRRHEAYYQNMYVQREFRPDDESLQKMKGRWSNISTFVQDLSQQFSRWFNRTHYSEGHVWSCRFKSVLIEGDRALLACMVYIDLNSIRAGLASRPEDYPFCSLYELVHQPDTADWIELKPLIEVLSEGKKPLSRSEALKKYLRILQHEIVIGKKKKAADKKKKAEAAAQGQDDEEEVFEQPTTFLERNRYFTDGVFLGSREFCEQKFTEFNNYFNTKRSRKGRPVLSKGSRDPDSLLNFYSIRQLSPSIQRKRPASLLEELGGKDSQY